MVKWETADLRWKIINLSWSQHFVALLFVLLNGKWSQNCIVVWYLRVHWALQGDRMLCIPCVFPLILAFHTRYWSVEQSDRAAGHALARIHEETSTHSEELCREPAKVRRPHLPQTLPRLPFPCWLWAQQTQRWEPVIIHREPVNLGYCTLAISLASSMSLWRSFIEPLHKYDVCRLNRESSLGHHSTYHSDRQSFCMYF